MNRSLAHEQIFLLKRLSEQIWLPAAKLHAQFEQFFSLNTIDGNAFPIMPPSVRLLFSCILLG